MEAFEYAHPKSKEEVVKLLEGEWGKKAVVAGGTDRPVPVRGIADKLNRTSS